MNEFVASLIKHRNGKDISLSENYFASFRRATRFVVYENEFIPFELFQESKTDKELLKQLVSSHGKAQVVTKYDKKLSKFYKKHSIKREINYIADSISYLKIPSIENTPSADIEVKYTNGYNLSNLKILASYQSQSYNSKDAQLRSIGQSFADNLLTPTNDWLGSLDFNQFETSPERYWQVAGVFKKRIWGQLNHQDHLDKKVFLCLGIDLEKETIFYGLECLRTGTSKLSTEQIYKFDLLTRDRGVMIEFPLSYLETIRWKDFVVQSQEFLSGLVPLYQTVIDYIWHDIVDANNFKNKLIPMSAKHPSESNESVDCNKKINGAVIDMVIRYEKDYLKYKGKKQLAKQVVKHDDYDVISSHLDGSEKLIKVIGSKSSSIQGALISQAHIDLSILNTEHSYLYVVTNLSIKKKSGLLFTNKGRFDKILKTKPERFTIC